LVIYELGAVHIRCSQSEGGGCPLQTRGSGFADMDSKLCKKLKIFENYYVSAGTKGEDVEAVRTFFEKRDGSQFAICADGFY